MAIRTLVLSSFFILIFSTGSVAKGSLNNGGNKSYNKGEKPPKSIVKKARSFSSLEVFENDINSTENTKKFFLEDALLPVTVDEESVRKKNDATYKKIIDENRFVDFLDLPVGLRTYIAPIESSQIKLICNKENPTYSAYISTYNKENPTYNKKNLTCSAVMSTYNKKNPKYNKKIIIYSAFMPMYNALIYKWIVI